MKNIKILLALPGLLAVQSVLAQTEAHLKLSEPYPSAGEKITLTYNPTGTKVDGKKNITATVYYLDNKDFPAADIDFKANGNLLNGELTVPATAKAFFIKISSDDLIDNNNDKGYVYLVYKDKQPVEGAYALQALTLSGIGNHFAKIKTDNDESIALYKQEFALYPNSEKEYQSNYYYLIARNPEYKTAVNEKVILLEKSTDEKDLTFAANLLKMAKNTKGADSLNIIIKTRFPDGLIAKDEMITSFFEEKDLSKKDSIFNVFVKKYPENGTDKYSIQNTLETILATAYLQKEDTVNYKKYANQIKDKAYLYSSFNNIAWEWALKGEHLGDAEKLSKQTVDFMAAKVANPTPSSYVSPKQAKTNSQANYDTYADTYAYILYKEGKSAEALKYMQGIYDRSTDNINSSEHYVLILGANGQYDKALEVATKSLKSGQSSNVLSEELKKDYVKVKGSNNGYDKFYAEVENESKNQAMIKLAQTMINQPAPVFTLKDIAGKPVSLAELKGKVVIVDFWATWCGPCKASLPGMQMAVNKYKDNPNVKFLFIDTWENGDAYLNTVKKFMTDNKYTFQVLEDEKGGDGRQSKVVTAFEVSGIPTKFIIDKNGNIRFKYVGYSGTSEKLLDEITNMVDMAGNPEAYASNQKPSETKAGSK